MKSRLDASRACCPNPWNSLTTAVCTDPPRTRVVTLLNPKPTLFDLQVPSEELSRPVYVRALLSGSKNPPRTSRLTSNEDFDFGRVVPVNGNQRRTNHIRGDSGPVANVHLLATPPCLFIHLVVLNLFYVLGYTEGHNLRIHLYIVDLACLKVCSKRRCRSHFVSVRFSMVIVALCFWSLSSVER